MNPRSLFTLIFLFLTFYTFFPGLIYSESLTITVCVEVCSIPTATPTPTSSNSTGSSGGGGGGGGGGGKESNLSATVIFEGIAYPGRNVVLLKDGQLSARVPAGPDARFRITLSGLSGGTYTFGTWSEDSKGVRSLTYSFTVTVTSGVTTDVSGIFIPPTISLDKTEVRHGDPIVISGQTAPLSNVSIMVHSGNEILKEVVSDSKGLWQYVLDTLPLQKGYHETEARVKKETDVSSFSQRVKFIVGDKNIVTSSEDTQIGDGNNDGKVNVVDFSIMAYWYKRPLTDEVKKTIDLNGDGKIDLTDFSILAYHWTG